MILHVKRETLGPDATAGTMWVDGVYFGFTLELPWKDNKQAVSCIPEGEYPVEITLSYRFKKALPFVRDVPNRSGIRIHNANRPSELRGCIAVASKRIGPTHIYGGLTPALTTKIRLAQTRAEPVKIQISNPGVPV